MERWRKADTEATFTPIHITTTRKAPSSSGFKRGGGKEYVFRSLGGYVVDRRKLPAVVG